MSKKKANADKSAETINPTSKSTLNLKQQAFLDNYIDNTSKTYGNITQSYMKAYNTDNYNAASTSGFNLLRNTKIQTEYDRLCVENNIGDKVRLNALSNIVNGNYKQKTTKRQFNLVKDEVTGQEKMKLTARTETLQDPSARDISHTIGIVEKISIEYKKAGLNSLSQLSDNARNLLSNIKDVTNSNEDSMLLQIAEQELSNDSVS